MESLKRAQLIVFGVVQGVGFRKFIERTAKELNLSGWVRNLSDGTVEINAQGPGKALDELFRHVKNGSARSTVFSVHKTHKEPDLELGEFTIIT
jgi:acylphosphatase